MDDSNRRPAQHFGLDGSPGRINSPNVDIWIRRPREQRRDGVVVVSAASKLAIERHVEGRCKRDGVERNTGVRWPLESRNVGHDSGARQCQEKVPSTRAVDFQRKRPSAIVVTVADEVATEMPASGCPPFVAVTAPENSETTGGGGGAGGAGVGGADGVAGEEEPQAETNPHRMTASTRFMVGPV